MTQDVPERFSQRVEEKEVADVLNMIHAARNMRFRPLPGDLKGDYDGWFDGGAIKTETGCTEYHFKNGVTARVPVILTLCVSIRFPDGRRVTIEQEETSR
jgi:hypothetical protein